MPVAQGQLSAKDTDAGRQEPGWWAWRRGKGNRGDVTPEAAAGAVVLQEEK